MSASRELARSFVAAILATTERLPVSIVPDEGTFSAVDNGMRRVTAQFRGGAWVRLNGQAMPFEPTHWIRIKARD